ncbi:NAD(P)-dependent oxidoreductase [Dyella sp. GSA-30]|uniref:NAD-dependent epimerase/dehydratase family protein n=1 Tax=Dyella sp. GSA-30 TaxID=2994496 RepID=UPI0024930745|nr:NAD(P)-dependent oxidoreductase [Dyella sp. GSA-30]BDU21958.1 oxidoreductase [Dyella sp. GSA-30]
MKILVTGSAGHLGEALMRTLRKAGRDVLGIDLKPSPFTDRVGSISDRTFVRECLAGIDQIIHTATLHKPHVATHAYQDFIDTNITGTLNLLEEAASRKVGAFVFTSTTSVFGSALVPPAGEPAAWITEDVVPVPKNIYGVSKLAAENLCELFARRHRLPAIVLRTSRFFPEADDDPQVRSAFAPDNAQANELLYRRADIEDVVSAHLLALDAAPRLGFGRYIVSATTPFEPGDLASIRLHADQVVQARFPACASLYAAQGWHLLDGLDRVYVNTRAREALGWQPRYGFQHVLDTLRNGTDIRSPLAREVGSKGYHDTVFTDGPYPVM